MIQHFSCAGTRHQAANIENQDAFSVCSNDRYSVMVLADGVSSCTHAAEGAQLASKTAAQLLLGCADYFMNAQPEMISKVLLRNILYELDKQTDAGNAPVEAFSSTLSFVLHDRKHRKLLLFRLGDGLIVGKQNESCICLLQPDNSINGTCVTTTRYAERQCSIQLRDAADYQAVMLLTDGAWRAFTAFGRIRHEVEEAFVRGEYHTLQKMLQKDPPADDHSYLILQTA